MESFIGAWVKQAKLASNHTGADPDYSTISRWILQISVNETKDSGTAQHLRDRQQGATWDGKNLVEMSWKEPQAHCKCLDTAAQVWLIANLT